MQLPRGQAQPSMCRHGVARLRAYFMMLREGLLNPRPNVRIVSETASTATVDGDNGLGCEAAGYEHAFTIACRLRRTPWPHPTPHLSETLCRLGLMSRRVARSAWSHVPLRHYVMRSFATVSRAALSRTRRFGMMSCNCARSACMPACAPVHTVLSSAQRQTRSPSRRPESPVQAGSQCETLITSASPARTSIATELGS